MWNARVLVFVLCLVMINVISAKRFETRCKLVRELLRIGMPNDMFLGQWVCLIEQVSGKETSAFKETPSGKKFYGLYQIPKEWCREKKRGGLCNLTCEGNHLEETSMPEKYFSTACKAKSKGHGRHKNSDTRSKTTTRCKKGLFTNWTREIGHTCPALLDDDIRDDTACALQIAEKHGFKYWTKWTARCKNDNFITTEIYKCPDLMRLTPERSLSSNSQYRRSPPRLRRSTKTRRTSKVSRFRRSRQIN